MPGLDAIELQMKEATTSCIVYSRPCSVARISVPADARAVEELQECIKFLASSKKYVFSGFMYSLQVSRGATQLVYDFSADPWTGSIPLDMPNQSDFDAQVTDLLNMLLLRYPDAQSYGVSFPGKRTYRTLLSTADFNSPRFEPLKRQLVTMTSTEVAIYRAVFIQERLHEINNPAIVCYFKKRDLTLLCIAAEQILGLPIMSIEHKSQLGMRVYKLEMLGNQFF